MFRKIFTPTPKSHTFLVTLPDEWYGIDVEIIAFPVNLYYPNNQNDNNTDLVKERKQKREEILKKYSFSRKDYKFDRDEANNYE